MAARDLILRNVEVEGRGGLDVRLADGRIAEVGPRLAACGQELDGRGGALIPGLIDHHIHLLAAAAKADSLALDDVAGAADLAVRLTAFAAARPPGTWIRAVGYHEAIVGLPGRAELDALVPAHPLRIQHRTGGLWLLNSLALARLGEAAAPEGLERDAAGAPTGRLWRGDSWLSDRLGRTPPPLAPLGRTLAAAGVTGLMDASVTTNPAAAALLAEAVRSGALPQRLGLMSGGALAAPHDGAIFVGPLKILLDDHALPDLAEIVARIGEARGQGRAVAVHCVAAGELAVTLAAFEAEGAQAGDRIEHGGLISSAAVAAVAAMGLTVVTQPAFIFERGDRYLAEVDPAEHGDLYRCASLLAAGVPVAASSDAPYASPDPWIGVAAAVDRLTRAGRPIGLAERVTPRRALDLYLGPFDRPGGPSRRIAPGQAADLCLLKAPEAEALDQPGAELVAATLVGGEVTFEAG
ncbi:MAG: amidohydrolase family protein [Caulobacteraceae bacterium]|nr:amidohydrolase family protein [Caulobacteraceae bacterium]